jgi:hypothetical protein
VAISKCLQSREEGTYANLYKQIQGRKILGKESEIRRISQYKKREQDNETEDRGSSEEWCFSGNPKKFNMLVQVLQVRTKSK